MRTCIRILALTTALLWFASGASAGTALLDPPFPGGGFVPPTKDVMRQESRVDTLIEKHAKNLAKCDIAAVLGLQLAYTPANPTKISDVEAAWTACVAKVGQRFVAARDKLLLKGTPACLDQAGIDALRATIEGQGASLATPIYCDADGASPDPVVGLDIPDKKKEANGETDFSKVIIRTAEKAAKCYSKGVTLALRLGGALDASSIARIEGCVGKVLASAGAAIDTLDQTQELPSCLPVGTANGVAADAVADRASLTSALYCASPSGAFVDGVAPY